ncbi:ABC transporter ATP-binding protein [Agarivorans sp. QJM3NY_33]|uniref:ABC transporter ATP-binding protein n=1 Tax=Agarivorans sp. QJM3NY_33 TaxID=3421432 RepID=UPI003D7E0706
MLELHHVIVRHQQNTVLNIPELRIAAQQITVILGHNGSGKSTLMKLLARQQNPTQGRICLNQHSLERLSQRQLAQQLAYLPQRLPDVAGLTVTELVRLGRFPWRGTLGRWKSSDHLAVQQALRQTNVSHYGEQLADQLSGGERQRAWIAMLLAQQAPMLLLDEPTSALDLSHQYDLMQLLRQLNQQQQRGIVVILHDVNLACRFADRILALKQGQICFDGSPQQLLTPANLRKIYGLDFDLIKQAQQNLPVAAVAYPQEEQL